MTFSLNSSGIVVNILLALAKSLSIMASVQVEGMINYYGSVVRSDY